MVEMKDGVTESGRERKPWDWYSLGRRENSEQK
jgi:hypothetical protein